MADASAALLLRAGAADSHALAAAAELKQREGGTLGEALVRLGLIEEERLLAVFQHGLLVPRISSAVLQRVPKVVQGLVPAHLAVAYRVVPVELDSEGNLTLAMADPADNRAVDEIATLAQRYVMRAVAAPSTIREALLTHYRAAAVAAGLYSVLPINAPAASPAPAAVPPAPARAASGVAPAPTAPPASGGRSAPRRAALPPAEQLVPGASLPRVSGMESLRALSHAVDPVTESAKARKARSGRATGQPGAASGTSEGRPRSGRGRTTTEMGAPAKPAAAEAAASAVSAVAPSLQAPVARLQGSQTRDEVVTVLLDYASQLAARVGLFVVQQGQLTCLDGRGPDHVVVAMKWFTIPVDTPSPFRDVLQSRKAYMGSLADNAESRAFRNALGSSPGELLLLPLLVGERVVGVLYADELKADLQRLSSELETVSQEAGAAFARIILSRKRKS